MIYHAFGAILGFAYTAVAAPRPATTGGTGSVAGLAIERELIAPSTPRSETSDPFAARAGASRVGGDLAQGLPRGAGDRKGRIRLNPGLEGADCFNPVCPAAERVP